MFSGVRYFVIRANSDFQRRNASQVAFIGLGNMGARMVNNLITKGEKLKIFDIDQSIAASIKGAQACSSPQEAVKDCDLIFTMLPNGDIVKETIAGKDGILPHVSKNSLLVDCSTIEPQTSQELYEITKKNGVKFLDAPVSGGVTGAQAGTLCFMVGGEKENVPIVEPTLLKMGAKVHYCGKSGAGQVAKICNNLILGVTMMATSEALNLGTKLGLDPKLLTSIINISTGRSWSSETYNPVPGILPNVPSSQEYRGGFNIQLMAKDMGLAERAALSCGASVPTTALAHQVYRAMISNGYGEKDFSSVYEFLKGKK